MGSNQLDSTLGGILSEGFMADVDIIRNVRMLCLKKQFADAIHLAQKVQDPESRKTLVFICNSFEHSMIKVHAA